MPFTLRSIHAREAFDARGWPTLTAKGTLDNGVAIRAVPPGSQWEHHYGALQLRDRDYTRLRGRGVLQAVRAVNETIAPQVLGRSFNHQAELDALLATLDRTPDRSELGANALLTVSILGAEAGAATAGEPLWRYLNPGATVMPRPIFDLLSGGTAATPGLDFRSYQVIPLTASSYRQALEQGLAIKQALQDVMTLKKLQPLQAEDGGYAVALPGNRAALDALLQAIERARLQPGQDVALALDLHATALCDLEDERYFLRSEGRALDIDLFVETLEGLAADYPIAALFDPIDRDDWQTWERLQRSIGGQVRLIGGDFFASNLGRLQQAVAMNACGGIAVDLSQVATVTDALDMLSAARKLGVAAAMTAAPGETEDTTMADAAVAGGADLIRVGPLAHSERMLKYGRLQRRESEMGAAATLAGWQ